MKKLLFLVLSTFMIGCSGVSTSSVNASIDTGTISQNGMNILAIKHTYYINYFETNYKEEIMGKYVQTIQNSLLDVDNTKSIDRKTVATFTEDPLVSENLQVSTNDFYKSYNSQHKVDGKRVDKGHINPYSAFAFNLTAAKESMYIQNTDPQYSFFNEHQWEGVEQYVIKQVSLTFDKDSKSYKPNQENITVYTGALINKNSTIITDGKGHSLYVPDYYWKVISYNKGGKIVYEAWIGKNTPDNKDTNPDDIKFDVSIVKKDILSYYPNLKLEF